MAEVTMEEYCPSKLRFTHDSIKAEFNDGFTLEDTLRSIAKGHISVSDLPPMEVMEYQGKNYVVRGNRRLYLYQKLEEHGYIDSVEVKKIPFDAELFGEMHSTENEGKRVRIRGPMGYGLDDYLDEMLFEA